MRDFKDHPVFRHPKASQTPMQAMLKYKSEEEMYSEIMMRKIMLDLAISKAEGPLTHKQVTDIEFSELMGDYMLLSEAGEFVL